jgi:hypothetical protein
MYKGTWKSTLYYSNINNGLIDINTKEGWIDFIFQGTYDHNRIDHYVFNPSRLYEDDILTISSYFVLTIEKYNSKIISGSYQTQNSFDYGVFLCQKEKSHSTCCLL